MKIAPILGDEDIRKYYLGSRLTAVKDALQAQRDADHQYYEAEKNKEVQAEREMILARIQENFATGKYYSPEAGCEVYSICVKEWQNLKEGE